MRDTNGYNADEAAKTSPLHYRGYVCRIRFSNGKDWDIR